MAPLIKIFQEIFVYHYQVTFHVKLIIYPFENTSVVHGNTNKFRFQIEMFKILCGIHSDDEGDDSDDEYEDVDDDEDDEDDNDDEEEHGEVSVDLQLQVKGVKAVISPRKVVDNKENVVSTRFLSR